MAQQNIDLGTGANNNDGDLVYQAMVKAQANFTELYGLTNNIGSIKIFERPISLEGVDPDLSELSQIKVAVNDKDPGFSVPLGYLAVVSYYRTYSPGQISKYFYKDYYGIKTGAGFYGVLPAGPSVIVPTTITEGDLIKLGSIVSEPNFEYELGEIGSTEIQTAVNASSSEIIVKGFTVINALRSGVPVQYVFDGDEGSYGASWGNTAAHNFIDADEGAELNKIVDAENSMPFLVDSDLAISRELINRTIHVSHNDAIITIPLDSVDEMIDGFRFRLNFSGEGPHTVNYPETDGLSTLVVERGALVYCEKRANNEWIVKEVGRTEAIRRYTTLADMLTDQGNQTEGDKYVVTDGSGFTGDYESNVYVVYLGTTDGDEEDYLILSSESSSGGGVSAPTSKTGTTIVFTENALYNESAYLTSGELTLDLTGAFKGAGVLCYCDGYIPQISGEDYLITSGILQDTTLNILSFFYDGTNILLNIANAQTLSPPVLVATPGDEEVVLTWEIVLAADDYIIERDTDSGFGTATEIYNGELLTYTDTGLTNDTTYYYRAKSKGGGYITSAWGATVNATPAVIDLNLLARWDASNNGSITTVDGSVTQWNDLTANGNNLTEATKTPSHSDANDTVTFAGVNNTSSDVLSRDISEFDFQQSDDFTVLIKGIKMSDGAYGGHVLNNKDTANGVKGWSVNFSADTNTIFLSHDDGSTQNFASWAVGGSGFDDDVERDMIFMNDAGVLKIYDGTNTNVGTNGTESLGAITYGTTEFKIGCAVKSSNNRPYNGTAKVVKVWDKALDSTERDTELGL